MAREHLTTIEKILRASATMLPAETAHQLGIRVIESAFMRTLAGLGTSTADRCLPAELPCAGLRFPNPLGMAAGFDKDGRVAASLLDAGFGFVECGTVTPLPQAGNRKPRLFRLRADRALINRMGFNGEGLTSLLARLERMPVGSSARIGVNVGANRDSTDRIADYTACVAALAPVAAYLTLNVSSPNTPGLKTLQTDQALDDLLGAVGETLDDLSVAPPVLVKISADLSPAALGGLIERTMIHRCVRGLIVANTLSDRPDGLRSRHANQSGGLSGAPIFERTTDVLRDAARMCGDKLDLIGVGGIEDAGSAYAKLRSGARVVQVYTGFAYRGAPLIDSILTGLADMMRADGVTSIASIVGADL